MLTRLARRLGLIEPGSPLSRRGKFLMTSLLTTPLGSFSSLTYYLYLIKINDPSVKYQNHLENVHGGLKMVAKGALWGASWPLSLPILTYSFWVKKRSNDPFDF